MKKQVLQLSIAVHFILFLQFAVFAQMIAVDDLPFTSEEVPLAINVVANDINIGGGTLTVTLISETNFGTLDLISADAIIYTPQLHFFGTDTFSYEVCNGEEPMPACDIGFVIISIFPVADFPVANNDTVIMPAGTAADINVLANDINVDAEILVADIISSPVNGMATVSGTSVIAYTPDITFAGNDSIIYSACKSGSAVYCDTAVIYITVTTTNYHAPVALDDVFTATIGNSIDVQPLLNDTDADGDALVLSAVIYDMLTGVVTQSGNTLTYMAFANARDTLQYVVCDDNAPVLCDTANIVVNVLHLKLPDSFSPNGDGVNDCFNPALQLSPPPYDKAFLE
ncbi:MAG: Ig-like domain-containing protein, partial [Chitinophagales bacterium]